MFEISRLPRVNLKFRIGYDVRHLLVVDKWMKQCVQNNLINLLPLLIRYLVKLMFRLSYIADHAMWYSEFGSSQKNWII